MQTKLASSILLTLAAALAGCAATAGSSGEAPPPRVIADSPEQVEPVTVGHRAPAAAVRNPDGQPVDLGQAYAQAPTVLLFYRGGWCPYCSTHLSEIGQAEERLVEMGFQILAVSPDRPAKLRETLSDEPLGYQLLSDSDMELAQAYGLAFRVDEDTRERYRAFEIDLEDAAGRSHHLLPVPAIYLIDRQGVIRFAYWNPDHRERIEMEALLEAAEAMAQE